MPEKIHFRDPYLYFTFEFHPGGFSAGFLMSVVSICIFQYVELITTFWFKTTHFQIQGILRFQKTNIMAPNFPTGQNLPGWSEESSNYKL